MKAFDPLGALRTLVEHGVDFVVIGGLAARLRGSPSLTDDLDVCHSTHPDNLARLAEALRAMDARLRGAPGNVPFLLDAAALAARANFTFATIFGAVDCMALPAGVSGFDELRRNAEEMHFDEMAVLVASLDDLMRMKRAAGRDKDKIELHILAALREEIERAESAE